MDDFTGHLNHKLVAGNLQFFFGILQMLPDRQTLGTVLFAFAAADAVGCTGNIFAEGCTHEVLPQTLDFAF